MKIVTTKLHRRNQKVTFDGITVTFDNDCIAEVTSEEAAKIILKDDSVTELGKSAKNDKDAAKSDNSGAGNQNDAGDNLALLTVKELKAVAEEANLPKEEWETLKKVDLLEYIKTKTKE